MLSNYLMIWSSYLSAVDLSSWMGVNDSDYLAVFLWFLNQESLIFCNLDLNVNGISQ